MTQICKVHGCGRPVDSRGWCRTHYERWRVSGDVRAEEPIAVKGLPARFFHEIAMLYEGDECLIWPFARSDTGYAHGWVDGALHNIHRLLCERVHGPPPTFAHQAAHSCGCGHLGCVTKGHLSWKTPLENAADTLVHGTRERGEQRYNSKLNAEQARVIFVFKGTVPQRTVADIYQISRELVSRIQCGKAWAWATVGDRAELKMLERARA